MQKKKKKKKTLCAAAKIQNSQINNFFLRGASKEVGRAEEDVAVFHMRNDGDLNLSGSSGNGTK